MGERENYHTLGAEIARDFTGALLHIMDFKVYGRENLRYLKDTDEKVIYAFFPHTGHTDSPTLITALPPYLRRGVIFPAAAKYWFGEGLEGPDGWVRSKLRILVPTYPMNREGSGLSSVKESIL